MKVKELMERLSKMPQDLNVRMTVYDDCTYEVRNCEVMELRSGRVVEIDNYVECWRGIDKEIVL